MILQPSNSRVNSDVPARGLVVVSASATVLVGRVFDSRLGLTNTL